MTEKQQALFATGSVIDGRWVVIECIGKGGMGEVYRAHQLNLKRDVAIKVISADLLQDFEEAPEEMAVAIGRFQREVQTMASVRHPNILQIYDYGSIQRDDNAAAPPLEYISMEYIPGNTFRFTMSEEGFDTETELLTDWLRRFYLPVLDGVEAIHAHGIIHRDIKPENILMDGETPKIADFGLARSFQMRAVSNSWDVKGTMVYMAPEQFEDFRKAGPVADIYALGKILFEAVAGKMDPKTVPFKSVGLQTAKTPLLKEIDAIVRKATHEDKHQRFQTIGELRSAIMTAMDKANAASIAPVKPAVRSRRHLLGIIAIVAALAGMSVYHLYGWFKPARPPVSIPTGIESHPVIVPDIKQGPPAAERISTDGRTMILMPATEENSAFYSDRTPVTFHHYTEFLNQVAGSLSVNEGIVKKDDDIWLYLGSGHEPYEQIIYDHGRFHLRDAAWAGRPVVRVTWLGAMAYARQYGKAIPNLSQWQTILSQPETASTTPSPSPLPAPFQPDPHSQMMNAGSVSEPAVAIDPLTGTAMKPTKEWVGHISTAPTDTGHSVVEVQSHVADPAEAAMRSGNKAPLLRYPWEGFSDVGFRTIISLETTTSNP